MIHFLNCKQKCRHKVSLINTKVSLVSRTVSTEQQKFTNQQLIEILYYITEN